MSRHGRWAPAELLDAALTYDEVGATRRGLLPSGYHHVERTVVVGRGAQRFDEAVRALMGWQMHRRAGLTVRATRAVVGRDVVAVLGLGWRRLSVPAPVRVVDVLREPRRCGFAYGTLPGHPESGEELFLLEHGDDDQVTFTIRAFSRPATWWARVGLPVNRRVQSWVTERYLHSV